MEEKLEKVLHHVVLLCEQNSEFKSILTAKLSLNNISVKTETESFDSIIKLQHNRCHNKARNYYKGISDCKLRNDLIDAYTNMLWYRSIFEIGQCFVHVNYQIENMLNFYLNHTDFHDKIAKNPKLYCRELKFSEKYTRSIDVFTYAFDQQHTPIEITKISSIWAKILFWAIDTDQISTLNQNLNNFNSIINIRNEANHDNYLSTKTSTKYWQDMEDGTQFAFIEKLIKIFRNSIINLEKTQYNSPEL